MAVGNLSTDYIDKIGEYFNKLPQLPKGGREFIVTVIPWFALVFGILGIYGALSAFGLFTYFSGFLFWGGAGLVAGQGMIAVILNLVASVLLVLAFSGTKKRQSKGWNLLYYSEAVSLASSIVLFSLGGLFVALIGFYILYQIRGYYK